PKASFGFSAYHQWIPRSPSGPCTLPQPRQVCIIQKTIDASILAQSGPMQPFVLDSSPGILNPFGLLRQHLRVIFRHQSPFSNYYKSDISHPCLRRLYEAASNLTPKSRWRASSPACLKVISALEFDLATIDRHGGKKQPRQNRPEDIF
ncbi:MAG: hypothetical protein ACU0BN_07225, partial [Sulfitobacter sp.]